MRRIEKVLLMVFLVVSVICGKYLLDYWQVEGIAFPEKDTEDEDLESNDRNR